MLKFEQLFCGIPPQEVKPGEEIGMDCCGWFTPLKPGLVTLEVSVSACVGHSEEVSVVCGCEEPLVTCEATKTITLKILPTPEEAITTTITIASTITETEYAEKTTYTTVHVWTTTTKTKWVERSTYTTITVTRTTTTWTTVTTTTTVTSTSSYTSSAAIAFTAIPTTAAFLKARRRWRKK